MSAKAQIEIGYDPVIYAQCLADQANVCSTLVNPFPGIYYIEPVNLRFTESTPAVSGAVKGIGQKIETHIGCYLKDPSGAIVSSVGVLCLKGYFLPDGTFPTSDNLHLRNLNPICGSIVDVDNLAVGEAVPVVGTEERLVYFTNRVVGRAADYSIKIPVLIYPTQTSANVNLRVRVAGQEFTKTYLANQITPGLTWDVTWNGKDQSGQDVLGSATAEVEYLEDGFAGPAISVFSYILGGWKAHNLDMGGWVLSSNHYFDVLKESIYYGDGRIRRASLSAWLLDGQGKVRAPQTANESPNVYVVGSEDGSEAYLFDMQTGRHLQTRSARSGQLLKAFTYDVNGALTSVTDVYGKTTNMTRPNANQVRVTSPFSQVTTITLDANRWASRISTPGGKNFDMTYRDALGLIATFKKPNGIVSTMSYDSLGYLIRDESSSGAFWDLMFTINSSTQQKSIQVTSAEGRQTSYLIQPQPGVDSVNTVKTSPGGAISTTSYTVERFDLVTEDGFAKQTSMGFDNRFGSDSPNYEAIAYMQSSVGSTNYMTRTESRVSTPDQSDFLNLPSEVVTVTDENQNIWQQNYDGPTRKFSSVTPEGRTSQTITNDVDQITSSQVGNFLPVTFGYDNLGRLQSINQGSRTSTMSYGSNGFLQSMTNPLGQSTQFSYTADGELSLQVLPDGRQIAFTYDANGNVASVTPPSRPSHNFIANLFDLIASYIAPSLAVGSQTITSYQYNLDKQMTGITKPDGSQVSFAYGANAKLSSITTNEGVYSHAYNAGNQLSSIASPAGVNLNFSYDGPLVTSVATQAPQFAGSVNYLYDKFRPVQMSVAAAAGSVSSVNLTYDNDHLLASAGSMSITRDPVSGQVVSTLLGGTRENFTYDPSFGELSSYQVLHNGVEVFKEVYTRDGLGRISSKVVTVQGVAMTSSYTYDLSGRLSTVSTNGVLTRTYSYDGNSNRTSVVEGTKVTTGTYDAQDHMLNYAGRNYTYSATGDITSRYSSANSNRLDYTYDSLGGLLKVIRTNQNFTTGVITVDTFDYLNDGMGRRIGVMKNGAVQERYIYDEQGRLAAEINNVNGKIFTHFVYATRSHSPDYFIRGNVKYKIVQDQLGSVRMVINTSTGAIESQINYDEFGKITSSVASGFQPLGYAGGLRDAATGLVRFGARDYDPETGRWLSKDPILFDGGDSNLYGYVMSDPVNMIDPDGLFRIHLPGDGNKGGDNNGGNGETGPCIGESCGVRPPAPPPPPEPPVPQPPRPGDKYKRGRGWGGGGIRGSAPAVDMCG